jgi:MFS family permease
MTIPENTLRVGIPSPGPSFRGALASRDFSFFFFGQLGSEIGNGLIQLALPLLIYKITGSALQLGVAYFFQFLPMLLFGLLGGVLVDRRDRRLTIIVVDSIRAVAFLSAATIYYLDALTATYLYAVIFIESSLQNFFNPARAALLPNLVDRDNIRAANSLVELSRHIGFLVAVPMGGVVVELLGGAAIMLIDGVTFFVSTVSVFLIGWRQPQRDQTPAEDWRENVRKVFSEMKEGLGVIGRQRLLQVSLLLGLCLNVVVAPVQVLLPVFVLTVKDTGESYFGLLVAGLLFGLVTGSLTAPQTARRLGLGRMTIGAVLLLGVVLMIAAWPPTLWPPVIAMAVAGACIGSLNVAQTTMLQSSTSDDERGRVSATYYTVTLGVRPLSFLSVGALAQAVGDIRFLFVALGALAVAGGAFLARLPEVRHHH